MNPNLLELICADPPLQSTSKNGMNKQGSTMSNHNESDIEEDTVIANGAWTIEDARSSREGIAARYGDPGATSPAIMTPSVAYKNPTEQVVEFDKGIRRFWRKIGTRFTLIWKGMTENARKYLLLAVAPEMAMSSNQESSYGQLLLLPEFVVNDLVRHPNRLLEIIQNTSNTDLETQYLNDAGMIRNLIRQRRLEADRSKRDSIAYLRGRDYVGEILELDRTRMAELGMRIEVADLVDQANGYAIEGPVFSHVIMRRHALLQTLVLIMDEMQQNVFDRNNHRVDKSIFTNAMQCSNPGCTNTRSIGEDGNERALRRCKIAWRRLIAAKNVSELIGRNTREHA